jgi:hypothetical protein
LPPAYRINYRSPASSSPAHFPQGAFMKPARVTSALACVLLLAACAGHGGGSGSDGAAPIASAPAPSAAAAASPQAAQPARWGALLVSGDAAIPAFDNLVNGLADRLAGPAVPRARITAITARTPSPAGPSTVPGIARAAARMRLGANDGCLVYVTAHGSPAGVAIVRNHETLSPAELDRIVESGCGARPTVVVVSACFSGVFTGEAMRRPNRVILTAARPDRTSFGCAADREFTVFDGCMLDAVRAGTPWRSVAANARACVAAEERRLGATPSEPQYVAGDSVRDLAVP